MIMETGTIHIAYTTNRNYVSFAAISCLSLMESNPDTKFHIHVLGHELEQQDVDNIYAVIPRESGTVNLSHGKVAGTIDS